ncbi:uncharacterized protein CXQ87_003210 [Candidozyma duobushaemuli]|uniref:Heat shock transcription factor n=1 Tax=Candidozyma duobushaemuli TaxID=1231522 RepID=A0A2V1AET1_9ASCO|nr:uncharacterized protein CXQ87_003210 [[Candida] duobushaemulonis]PVH15371.1 hypothetical protein CXQ87_003210 [[Candida] duobushaemulonis]
MASYNSEESGSTRDNDIQVINRDEPYQPTGDEYHENVVSPSFPSLDLPTPNGTHNHLFDDLDNNQTKEDGNFPPSLSPLTEFVNTHGDHIINGENEDRNGNAGILTRLNTSNNYIPPMPALSESLSAPTSYMPNNYANTNRNQLMITGKKKKEASGPKVKPAFVMKVWSMVNDPENQEYIRWNDDGLTFQVYHREEFMKSILPKYFKHNNFASFVRQLNMYGWHKVQDISSGSMAKEAKNAEEVWQFKNPYFVRGREDLLDNIVRNKSGTQEEVSEPNINLQLLVTELDQIKMNQLAIIEDMRRIRKDNQTLWTESFATREKHQKQSHTIDKIMKFLAAVYGNSAGKIFEVENGNFDSNYGVPALYQGNQPARPSYNNTAPISKSRLMLMDQEHSATPSTDASSTAGPSKRPSVAGSKDGSIEEIVRNDHITPHDPSANTILPELQSPNIGPSTPSQQFSKLNSGEPNGDMLSGLEQNIFKQGQALSQVQDWIQALANRQQQQQHQLQQQKSNNSSPVANPDLDDFDVNEFLNSSNSVPPSQDQPDPALDVGEDNDKKRHIEEVVDNEPRSKRTRTRSKR